MKPEIILYENHFVYLDCIHGLLKKNSYEKNYQFKSTIDFEEIGSLISEKTSTLIMNIVGLNLNDIFDFIENTLKDFSLLKIMVLSPNIEVKMIKRFFDKGTRCVLTKNTNSDEFLTALKTVIEDKVYINEDAKNALFDFICNQEDRTEKKYHNNEELTGREMDVLSLICNGHRTKEIADKLFISTHTVESHRRNIMLKLNVNNTSKLVKFALENNLVN